MKLAFAFWAVLILSAVFTGVRRYYAPVPSAFPSLYSFDGIIIFVLFMLLGIAVFHVVP